MTEEMPADRDHDRLVPYLLGTLPDDLRQHIDARILSDEALFESLRATENELVYDYALSLLGPEERAQFEARFPANPAIRQKVANARDLLNAYVEPTVAPNRDRCHAGCSGSHSPPQPRQCWSWVGW